MGIQVKKMWTAPRKCLTFWGHFYDGKRNTVLGSICMV